MPRGKAGPSKRDARRKYSNAIIFGQVHQLTVDAYGVQHAVGEPSDESVGVHLAGLHLTIERGIQRALRNILAYPSRRNSLLLLRGLQQLLKLVLPQIGDGVAAMPARLVA